MSTQLAELGIEVYSGYDDRQFFPEPDCVVVGNALSRGNPAVEAMTSVARLMLSTSDSRQPYRLSNFDLVTESLTLKAGQASEPSAIISYSRLTPVVVSSDRPLMSFMVLDIGPKTAEEFADIVKRAGTVIWNGPVGVFEFDAFAGGTRVLAEAIAESDAFSVAGGGDTLAAIDRFGVRDGISYISTGGGAFLEFVEGKTLPAVQILEQRGA